MRAATGAKSEEVTFEPVARPDATGGLVPESIRRLETARIIPLAAVATKTTTVATSLPQDELTELDRLRREQGTSRAEVVREAVRWYARWGELLPLEDPISEEIEP